MVDSLELLYKLEREERNNQFLIARLLTAKGQRSLTKKEKSELSEAKARQTDNEKKYRKKQDLELESGFQL